MSGAELCRWRRVDKNWLEINTVAAAAAANNKVLVSGPVSLPLWRCVHRCRYKTHILSLPGTPHSCTFPSVALYRSLSGSTREVTRDPVSTSGSAVHSLLLARVDPTVDIRTYSVDRLLTCEHASSGRNRRSHSREMNQPHESDRSRCMAMICQLMQALIGYDGTCSVIYRLLPVGLLVGLDGSTTQL